MIHRDIPHQSCLVGVLYKGRCHEGGEKTEAVLAF